jgi:hypothetical protein
MPMKVSNPPKQFKNQHDPPQSPKRRFFPLYFFPQASFISYTFVEEQCFSELF